jgi:hypothetical protein
MIHWLEYGGIRSRPETENRQLEELRRYLRENPTAKAEGYLKTTGDMYAKIVRLECNHAYGDLDLDCNSMSAKSLKRYAHKPSNIEYSEKVTQKIYGTEPAIRLHTEKGEPHPMDENTAVTNEAASSAPLAQNEYVTELFSILQDNGRDTKGLAALIGHVSEMESFVKRAEDKIADMKSQLAEMKEVQNHPVKTALQNAIKALERKVAEVKEQIGELKTAIVEGCKSAVAAFREKGAAALNNLAKFFHIKGALKTVDRDMEQSIKICDKSIANINSFADQYHSAGRAIKNMGRMLTGKEPIDAKKEAGKLAGALSAPYKAQKKALNGIRSAVNKAITALEAAEERQAQRQAERGEKPDMLAKISKNKERVEREKLEVPAPERAKTQEAVI